MPDSIIHAAAKVDGIGEKTAHPTPFLMDNSLIDTSVLRAAIDPRTPKLLCTGSAAVHPATCVGPIIESDLLAGPLESASDGYGIAKVASARVCEYVTRHFEVNFEVALRSNLYGVQDHFEPKGAHLLGSKLRKVHEAKAKGTESVNVWSDGTTR